MGGVVTQMGFFGDQDRPTITSVFAQVKFVLEAYPELRGKVGAVVVRVWHEFYKLEELVRAGDYETVAAIIGGEAAGVPNYKTVSRNYHRVCEKFPGLYKEPAGGGE